MSMADLKSCLMEAPDWKSLTAYEMTKRLCAEMTSAGEKVPSWTAIRDIIGKGSAGDINRAKDDYRKEHGEDLRKMAGFVDGVPAVLAPHILGLWAAAIDCVKLEYAAKEEAWTSTVSQANERVLQADLLREEARHELETAKAHLSGLQQANTALQQQLRTEQSSRLQAEKLYEQSRSDQASQRIEFSSSLAQSQEQLNEAITRLEGVENHALRQVQEARDEARKKIEAAEARLKAQNSDFAVEQGRLNRQLIDLRQKLIESDRSASLLELDKNNWKERAERAEGIVDQLSANLTVQEMNSPNLRARIRSQSNTVNIKSKDKAVVKTRK